MVGWLVCLFVVVVVVSPQDVLQLLFCVAVSFVYLAFTPQNVFKLSRRSCSDINCNSRYEYIKSLKFIKCDINRADVVWAVQYEETWVLQICLSGEFVCNILGVCVYVWFFYIFFLFYICSVVWSLS